MSKIRRTVPLTFVPHVADGQNPENKQYEKLTN